MTSASSIGEADGDLAASRGTAYETDGKFLAALDEQTKPREPTREFLVSFWRDWERLAPSVFRRP